MLVTLEGAKEYLRVDIEDDDKLIEALVIAAEEYLKGATGKEYPTVDEDGQAINYELEKIYIKLLIAYWYENRTPAGKVGEEFSQMTKSLMLQLQNK